MHIEMHNINPYIDTMFNGEILKDKIKEYCKRNGVTQEWVAKKAGLNLSTLVRYYKITQNPRKENLRKLGEIISNDVSQFYKEIGFHSHSSKQNGYFDIDLKKIGPKNANEYIKLFRASDDSVGSYIDNYFAFEPITQSQVDLCKNLLKFNENIESILYSDVNINTNPYSEYFKALNEEKDEWDKSWDEETHNEGIAKLSFLAELNQIFWKLEHANIYLYASSHVETHHTIVSGKNISRVKKTSPNGVSIKYEGIELYVHPEDIITCVSTYFSDKKNDKYTKNVSSKSWGDYLDNIEFDKIFSKKKITRSNFLNGFTKYYWQLVAEGNDPLKKEGTM